MRRWLTEKSADRQVQEAEASLARLIAVANAIEEAQREPTPTELAALEELRHVFRVDLLGPMPLEAIKCVVIDPALAGPGVSDTARAEVTFAYEVLRLFETPVVPHARSDESAQ
jgi:hypothetical protein